MKKHLFLLLYAAAVILSFSCATAPSAETEDPAAGDAVLDTDADSPESADKAVEETGPDEPAQEQPNTGAGTAGEAGDETELAGNLSETPADEIPEEKQDEGVEVPPTPEPLVSPVAPGTGEEVTILLDSALYETVTFDFGDGPGEKATYTYSSFGIKSVVVTAVSGDWTGSTEISFPVAGSATLKLAADTVEHDAGWRPVIDAELEGEGDFDRIIVYENGREILTAPRPREYRIPVPFVGERTFTGSLLQGEIKVAEVSAVTITGLNSPPERPQYEGEKFLNGRPGEEISFTVTAADPNNNTLEYEIRFAPEGVLFDRKTGEFSWVPTNAQRGVYLLHITAVDQPYGLVSPFVQRGITVQ